MGLYNIIRQKRGKNEPKSPEGEPVETETKEEFFGFCESLKKDFRGVMRLYSRSGGKTATAALLLEDGNIIGASFEDPGEKSAVFKEDAVKEIKKRLSGTSGNLEVYSFSHEGMEQAKKENQKTLLSTSIPFSHLGMKIRSHNWTKNPSSEQAPVLNREIKELRIEEGFDLVDFARKFSNSLSLGGEDLVRVEDEVLSKEKGKELLNIGLMDPKRERLAELKKKRQMEDLALMRKISQITSKKPESGITDVSKVETSIDRLYQLVQKYKRLKIDNDLAKKLGVSRSQIEGWAMILEEHNLVELHYPAIGEPEIRKTGK